jgi:hypothetical protein
MFQIQDAIDASGYTAPDGVVPEAYWLGPPPSDRQSSWEWAGEWTVTYETFRDMGAAFMVALVLIYILVVWEFGNFRIPLVIMAPIPLTLLGIIPAHFLMFQLGLGGEFTATSMIGWIALAGIIVRNSILLVDFSIHEVQKGVPVAEAVIRSCKTRTRPILITALALVAGSSVIFTDQIFQGMAISLASGVLVSTVLTLIVIPLGCVAASKDMCEVAVATAHPGVNVPCSAEEAEKARKGRAKPAGGGLIKAWGFLVEAFVLVFYAVRGIFLLLFDLIKNLFKKKRVPPPPNRPGTSGTGGAPSGGGGGAPPPSIGPAGATSATAPASESAASAESDQPPPAEGQPKTASKEPPREAPSASVAPDPEVQAASPVQPPAARNSAAVPRESAKRASSPAVEPSKEGGVAVAKAPAPKQRTAKKRVAKKASAKSGAKSRVTSPAMAQKKAPRRGIRLKADGGRGPSFD